jgi:hypothetical protein
MRKLMRAGAIVCGAVATLVLAATPASAYSIVYQGSDYAQTLRVQDDILQVCDKESDGHGVWSDYVLNTGASGTLLDGNGSASPCYIRDWSATPYWVHHYRVCERYVACSGWRYTDGPGGG